MRKNLKLTILLIFILTMLGCATAEKQWTIQSVEGAHRVSEPRIWLSHEHILVDFIGADHIKSNSENHDKIINEILPYLESLKKHKVRYFVDATPNYIGRDVVLLEKLSQRTGLTILTNTGLYGARNKIFIPQSTAELSAEDLAKAWIDEYENGIDGTSIKPGFIKIGVDAADPLHPTDEKLIRAAAITSLATGLTIASHTGAAKGLWPQLRILEEMGVSPDSFIWVHAQDEADNLAYLKAVEQGYWVSLDGLGWDLDKHIEKLMFAKQNGILNKVLISHDSGWYDPQKEIQTIKPYTDIFTKLYPELTARGFTDQEFDLLIKTNPAKAFALNK